MATARRLVCLLLLIAAPALAQTPLEPSRLPANTTFYLFWRGTASLDAAARGANSLFRLWNDPGFAPARQALAGAFYASAQKNQSGETQKRGELEETLSLLENALVIGFAGSLEMPGAASGAAAQPAGTLRPWTFFAILDTTGKEAILRKLEDRMLEGKERPTITSYAFGPTTVDKVVRAKETYYRATVGRYAIRADQQALVEDLITRLRSPDRPAASLEQVPEFRSVQKNIDAGALAEFFGRVPDLSGIPAPAKEAFDSGAFLRGLHLERLRAVVGSLSLREATRLRAAALGDTSAGSIFDLVGESTPTFATLPLAPAGTLSYDAGKINLVALYQALRSALEAALPPKQRATMELFEALAANQIEMKVPDALALLKGEIATIATTGDLDPSSQLYAATIQQQPQVLKLLRTVLAAQIASEEREGDATYLKLSFASPGSQAKNGATPAYYLGVTPQMLLVGPQMETLRAAAARIGSKDPAAAPLAADAGFRRARVRLPESLSSLGYLDLARIEWEKLIEGFQQGLKKANPSASSSAAGTADLLRATLPAVFRRYLHSVTSGSWKDRDAVYFDGYIE